MMEPPYKIHNVSLEAVAVKPAQYPAAVLPEYAFVGRSHVGKSSLLNAMVERKALARTSQAPGKTRTINFYNVEDELYFVDLPGYGYAKASKSDSQKWGPMIEEYLLRRVQLRKIVFLLDVRHEPGGNDQMMLEWFRHYGHEIVFAATKADKVTRNRLPRHIAMIRKSVGAPEDAIVAFSSETKLGREALWHKILL